MIGHIHRSWAWFKERAEGTHAKVWLSVISFAESIASPLPPDPLLAAIILAGSPRWLYYGLLTTVMAILGAILGYVIGAFFFDSFGSIVIGASNLESEVAFVRSYFNEGAFISVFLAALTPIPYKVFVLTAGFLKIDFIAFLVASVLGRGLRYMLVAYAAHRWGEGALAFGKRYTTHITIISFIVFALYIAYIVVR